MMSCGAPETAFVSPIRGRQRISFAAYYYTKEALEHWDGTKHTTIFKARPQEPLRAHVLMPLEKARRELVPSAKRIVKKLIGRR